VARPAGKGNEEKFSFWAAGVLDFRRVETWFHFEFSRFQDFSASALKKIWPK
jgi:hypothetical protein